MRGQSLTDRSAGQEKTHRKLFPSTGPGELHLSGVTGVSQTTLRGISETSFYSRGNGDTKLRMP